MSENLGKIKIYPLKPQVYFEAYFEAKYTGCVLQKIHWSYGLNDNVSEIMETVHIYVYTICERKWRLSLSNLHPVNASCGVFLAPLQ